jgi:hypothetical protein
MISVTAVLLYDYCLTFNDEVGGFLDGDVEMNLNTSCRSATHGRPRALWVRKPSHFLWNALANDISVLVLFLLVSVLHC